MGFTGGDILEITYNHEDLGSGTLFCKSNEDATVDNGGYRNNDDANQATSDGQLIIQKNWVRASVETPPISWDMTDRDEMDKLVKLAESTKLADWTFNHISGAIWSGKGIPVGDIQGATNSAQVGLKVAFNRKLKKIS